MNLREILTDELCHLREQCRIAHNWKLSDAIRDELASRGSFVIDTKDGQEVYHTPGFTKDQWTARLEYDRRSNALFDAWLFTMSRRQITTLQNPTSCQGLNLTT